MKIIDKIFRDKKSNTVIYIILAVGILMLVCANSAKHSEPYFDTSAEIKESSSVKEETERILSEIDGVGEVSVMISFSGSNPDEVFNTSAEEKRIESVLVVADGGEIPSVREKIVRALKVALGVDAHKIEVFERKERK